MIFKKMKGTKRMKKRVFLSGVLAAFMAVQTELPLRTSVFANQDDNWVLTWSDEFDKDSLDMTKWTYDIGNWKLDENGNYETNGWGNNEQEFYTDKNAEVSDGTLKIYAKKEQYSDPVQGNYDYTSAKLITQGKFDMCYGKVDIRARFDSGKSLWPALWMLPTDSVYGRWAASGEIDIMEGWGSTPEKVCGTIHFGDTWPGNTYLTKDYFFTNGDSTENWHNYSVEWESGEIRWYIDNVLYSTQNQWNSAGRAFPAPFDQNFYLILNLAVGGTFDGIDGVAADPATFADGMKKMEVDYVRVYQKDGKTHIPDEPLQKSMKSYIMEGGDGSVSNSDSGTSVQVNYPGDRSYSVMAALENVMVEAGKTYAVNFDITSSVNRNIELTIENSSYDRFMDELVYITGEKQHFDFECSFTENMASDLKFQLGKIDGEEIYPPHTIEISNLSFSEKSDEESFWYGDLNLDGVADLTDLTILSVQCMTGTAVSGEGLLNADVNDDKIVDIADLATMKQYVSKDTSVVLGKRK